MKRNFLKFLAIICFGLFFNAKVFGQKFNKKEAKIFPKSDFQIKGNTLESEIVLIAYDSTQNSQVMVNGKSLELKNGVAYFEEEIIDENDTFDRKEQIVKGIVKFGNTEYPFETSYIIYNDYPVIATNLIYYSNKVYSEFECPIQISVPEIAPENVLVTLSKGKITRKKNNEYSILVEEVGEIILNISEMKVDSSIRFIESKIFNVIDFPRVVVEERYSHIDFPNSYCNTKNTIESLINKPNEIFECRLHDLKLSYGKDYKIVSYYFQITNRKGKSKPRIEVIGKQLNEECLKQISDLKEGDLIIIDEIKVEGEMQKRINLAPIVIRN